MSDTYTRFVRQLKAAAAAKGMDFPEIAETLNVSVSSVRGYWKMSSVMSAETMLRAIKYIMGGYKC